MQTINLTLKQFAEIKPLIKSRCCNCYQGNCLLLDDGDPHTCPQLITPSHIICRYFLDCVLPSDNALMKSVTGQSPADTINGQIITQAGKYRFEAPFTIDGNSETKYSAWIEFELAEGVEGITVHTFKPIELVYDDGMYSFVQSVENAPRYMIVNGMQLVVKTDDSVSESIGTFEEITLNKDNFDSRFRGPADYSWLANDTLNTLKDNNKRIWQLYGDSSAETPHLYILLEQKDGTFYLGFGYYNCNSNNPNNPDDSHIRWLYKLEEVAENNNTLTNNTPLSNFQSLKDKYPQFFNVSTDGGLTVYIWQMSKDNYSCNDN